MDDTELRALLNGATTIAVVGASTDRSKEAQIIPAVLLAAGYTMIPVHPTADEILGQKAYAKLSDIPVHVDIVDVFRPADEAADVTRQAVDIGAGAVWLQLDIVSPDARELARAAGLAYVEDDCIGATARRLSTRPPTR